MTILSKSADLQGRQLTGDDGAKLGTVREVFIDLETGRVEFLIVEIAAILGGGGKFHPLPWSMVTFDGASGCFRASMNKEALKAAPNYDRDQLSNPAYGWDRQASEYFSNMPVRKTT
jgi:sporulation protein YlmC with PRC-barrel domain